MKKKHEKTNFLLREILRNRRRKQCCDKTRDKHRNLKMQIKKTEIRTRT